jgi:hypothetical protein
MHATVVLGGKQHAQRIVSVEFFELILVHLPFHTPHDRRATGSSKSSTSTVRGSDTRLEIQFGEQVRNVLTASTSSINCSQTRC